MKEVNTQHDVGQNVKQCNWPTVETAHHIVVDIGSNKLSIGSDGIDDTKGEIK